MIPMSQTDSKIKVERQGSVTVVRFLEENILDEAGIHTMGQAILKLLEGEVGPKLVLDFEAVAHLSSAALGELIKVNNRVRQTDGQLRLCNIDEQILEVFRITRLNQLFNIQKSEKEALASLK